jgi:hypothetical protein
LETFFAFTQTALLILAELPSKCPAKRTSRINMEGSSSFDFSSSFDILGTISDPAGVAVNPGTQIARLNPNTIAKRANRFIFILLRLFLDSNIEEFVKSLNPVTPANAGVQKLLK